MTDAQLYGQGISFPPRIGPDGRWAASMAAQNVRESIQVILLTEQGERLMRPAFGAGLEAFLFRPNTVATHRLIEERVQQALARWEPRIRVQGVAVGPDASDPEAAVVELRYRLVATGVEERLTLALQFA